MPSSRAVRIERAAFRATRSTRRCSGPPPTAAHASSKLACSIARATGGAWVQALVDSEMSLLRSRFVIAADGATSRLRRTTFHPRPEDALSAYAVRAYFRCERLAEPVFSTYMPLEFEGRGIVGYGWVFPVDERTVNVGIGYWRGPGIEYPTKIRDVLASFVERLHTDEPSQFGHLHQISKLAGSPLGVQFRREHCEANGVVFVGDAARTTDPWSGEGIAYALHGAEADRAAHQH